ncbi:MAG: lyase family protein [Arenicella sp.]
MKNNYRTEYDLIGELQVPADALYGVQTQRAIELYPLNGEKPLSAYPQLVHALLQVKKIAVRTNVETAELDPSLGQAILHAIEQLQADFSAEHYPIHAFHGGGGISSNMNINEVIANKANRDSFGQALGVYKPIHPNDHVNLNNSTSDALTTACHFAIIQQWRAVKSIIEQLQATFETQAKQWQHVQKLSRTCLQDAVEISFADLFTAYATLVKRNQQRISRDVDALYQINLGGNVVGRKGDSSDAFFNKVIRSVNHEMGCTDFTHSANLFDCSQNHDDLIAIANRLDLFARGLIKIAKDFRLMASGPETGFGELRLPAVQPGSSAFPGKVNPTIPEYLIQCCMQVCGRCYAVQMTQDHGELDLNVWQAIVIHNVLDAMTCLENGLNAFITHCLEGVEPDMERNQQNINTLIPTLMRLKQQRGYSFATRVYKDSGGDIEQIRRYLKEQ